ncbi:MAG: O-antigen ligase family protein [Kiritimatiellales bacterium]
MDNTFHRQSGPDAVRLKRGLLALFLTAVVVFVSSSAIKSEKLVFMGAVIGIPLMIILFSHPVRSLYLALTASFTSLSVLRISSFSDASIFFAFAALSCFSLMLMHRGRYEKQPGDRMLFSFVAVILVLMAARGSGLKFLGSAVWGGSPYILVFAATFFYLFSRRLRVTRSGILWTVFLSVLLGGVNTLFQRRGFFVAMETMNEFSQVRLSWAMPLATSLLPLALVIHWKRIWLPALLALASLMAAAATGFRGRIVSTVFLCFVFFYFYAGNRKQYVVKALFTGLLLWGAILAAAPFLPLGMQRAVSFVPGVTVNLAQASVAQGSTEWRFEIWKYCLQQFPEYWLIGRGIAFNVWTTISELGALDVQLQNQWFMFLTHSYHSGPLTLLIDYGLPGLLVMLTVHIFFIVKCFRMGKNLSAASTVLERFTLYFIALVLTQIFAYWVLFGKTEYLAVIIFDMGVVHIAYQSVLEERDIARQEHIAGSGEGAAA